ncbi:MULTISPECIES: hypothetical protein [Sphingobacterium]|jgi:hypothetical protein|uniref:Uncharacterized protein n=2 Tax=Sphingobacterium TaxID=28453 RepID=A0ABW5YRK3_9SPHI|nr:MULTISPECIES: hypothetical protein [Sphingobacterium]KKX48835.1 hypothetical protein L950_0218840 [Sphingobacterium sp. IITKGP-BTPF85]MBB2953147.1 hypothetical protein [Sphingobacterium sp. JUb56]MCS3555250.1 hypothetical protein [Sphingobacterium sp. JUb21]MCW2261591.1 hypothetical protein [Sphingobacterium kitahiroshimense]NJI75333.1 hypothetical protein [Sphingobacterium sp. B16(2022)]
MEIEEWFGASKNNEDDSQKSSPLKSLKIDLDYYSDSIKEISLEIMAEGLSAYPIFIAHQHVVNVGELILDHVELKTNWSINASTFEELVESNIIKEDRKDAFIKKFKRAQDFMCLLVIVPEGANFVFYPYK